MDEALPKCSAKYGRMASKTSGSTGRGRVIVEINPPHEPSLLILRPTQVPLPERIPTGY